jgi:hypothetical protein
MPGDVLYAHEKYAAARDILAEGELSLRDRLLDAYLSQAHRVAPLRIGLGPEISDDLAARLDAFHSLMTATPAVADEGTITATVRAMTEEEVRSAVRELLTIAAYLDAEFYESMT